MIIDEAHHCPARTYRSIMGKYPTATIIGLTATPCRRDGRGLGKDFDAMVESPQVQDLIDRGHLVPTKVFAPSTPDLRGVQARQGDYVEKQLAERVDRPELVGDIVTHWHRLADRRKTVVFATKVAHSIHIKDEFVKSGVLAEHIDGKTPKDERDEILARLSRGDLELVTNCMVLTEGWDQPDVACSCWRDRRSHGSLPADDRSGDSTFSRQERCPRSSTTPAPSSIMGSSRSRSNWTLDPDRTRRDSGKRSARHGPGDVELLTCTQCSAIRTAGKPCPNCGFMPRRPGEASAGHRRRSRPCQP